MFQKKSIIFRSGLLSLLLTFGLSSCFQGTSTTNTNTTQSGSTNNGDAGEYTEHTSENEESNPIELARRRAALRTIIRKGDYYQVKNDAEQAISYYEKAHEQLKDDPKIAIRLANAYLDVKRFSDAANVFTKLDIRQFDEPSKRKIITSIMLDGSRTDTAEIIQKLPFQQETKEYLLLIDTCAKTPEDCEKNINASTSKSGDILSLKNAVKGDSTTQDPTYTEALLTGELYKQKAYLAAFRVGKYIIARRPDYLSVLKMSGYSAYELGEYKASSMLLQRYYTSRTTDVDVAYMLGVVNFYLEDYVTSNLFFNNAVLNGYNPKEELERRLIYNYVLLGDHRGAFKVFRYLLDSSKVTAEDFQVGLFMAATYNERSKEVLWSRKGLQAFPDDPYILGFAGSVNRKNEEYDTALEYLNKAKDIQENNPLVSLEFCKIFQIKGYLIDAQDWCEKTVENDPGGYFAKGAEEELKKIQEGLTSSGSGNTTANTTTNTNSGILEPTLTPTQTEAPPPVITQ